MVLWEENLLVQAQVVLFYTNDKIKLRKAMNKNKIKN